MLAALPPGGARAQTSTIDKVLSGAYEQVGKTVHYDGAYRSIPFPGGDVPIERGVCTDVIVRAYRHAGIDHRRVPNLATFFRRHGQAVPLSTRREDYRAGDLVTWRLPSSVPHIGLVSDRLLNDRPLVIHNIGAGVQVEDVLFAYPITGHYRYDPSP